MKKCKRCLVEKPVSEFYRHKETSDGYLSFCKMCTQERVRFYRKSVRGREVERLRNRRRKKYLLERQKIYRKNNPEKYKARTLLSYALRIGKLKRGLCEVCGDKDTEAHHDDYSKPLEVRWLCYTHHRMITNK